MIRDHVRSLTKYLSFKGWECNIPTKRALEVLTANCLSSLHTSINSFSRFRFTAQQKFSGLPRILFSRWGGGFAIGSALTLEPSTVLCAESKVKIIHSLASTKVGSFSSNGVNSTLHVQLKTSLYPETKVVSIALVAKADPVERGALTWVWKGPIKIMCKLMDEQNNLLKSFTIHMSCTGSDEQVFENVEASIIQRTKRIACSIHV